MENAKWCLSQGLEAFDEGGNSNPIYFKRYLCSTDRTIQRNFHDSNFSLLVSLAVSLKRCCPSDQVIKYLLLNNISTELTILTKR